MNRFTISGLLLTVLGGIILFTSIGHQESKAYFCVNSPQDLEKLFPKTVAQIEQDEARAKEIIDLGLEKLLSVPAAERTFANTMLILDRLDLELSPIFGGLNAIKNLSPKKELRDASQNVMLVLSNYINQKLSLNKKVYLAVQEYADNGAKAEDLTKEQRYFLSEQLSGFKRSGLHLPDEELQKVQSLVMELTQLSQEYSTNIAKDDTKVLVSKDDLKSLKSEFLAGLKQNDSGQYILGLDYPTYFMIMDHCDNVNVRKKMSKAFSGRAYPANESVLKNIVAKRDQLAKLLGFDSYADLDLDSEMAKKPAVAKEFLQGVLSSAKSKAVLEIAELTKDLPQGVELSDGKIYDYDVRYLKSYYKKHHLNLDELAVSEYFPLENTVEKLLWVYENFLNLRFVQLEASGLWSDEVRTVGVYDNMTGKLVGYLLLDLFPRPNKYTHAAAFGVVPAVAPADDVPDCPAVAVVMANFPRPAADRDSLLMYSDVVTFFHEFGHAIHALLGQTALASQSGFNVKTDFVELPSQMLEDWLRDPEILAKVSKHYKTGQSLPADLIDKLVARERFDSGDFTLRQLTFGLLSLDLFASGADKDAQKIMNTIRASVCPHIKYSKDDNMTCSFGHLTGYGAKYYGYLWSKVFAKDLFAYIKQRGLLNSKVGREYIDKVIGQGGQKDPNELLVDFLGRKPNNIAFMHDMGF